MTLDRSRPEILTPPQHPPACCTQQTLTISPGHRGQDPAKTRLPLGRAPPPLPPPHHRLIVAAAHPHGEMRALPGRQQLESAISQAADGRQVDSPERGEPAREQIIEWLAEDREN